MLVDQHPISGLKETKHGDVSRSGYLRTMDEKYCPGCFSSTGLRKILYGMPASEPDPDIYVMAGCTSEDRSAQMQCIECERAGTTGQVRKATRARRFITTAEDLKGITVKRNFTSDWTQLKHHLILNLLLIKIQDSICSAYSHP